MNYYEFFELPVSPTIDKALLKKRFYQKSKAFHPDFYTLESPEKQAEVLELSSLNNLAYKVLRDDDKRLKYFLELKGALGEEGQNQVPQDFLMDIMEINEKLMELEFDDDPELRKTTMTMVQALEQELDQNAQPLLSKEALDEGSLEKLKDYYLKRRYLLRIKGKI